MRACELTSLRYIVLKVRAFVLKDAEYDNAVIVRATGAQLRCRFACGSVSDLSEKCPRKYASFSLRVACICLYRQIVLYFVSILL